MPTNLAIKEKPQYTKLPTNLAVKEKPQYKKPQYNKTHVNLDIFAPAILPEVKINYIGSGGKIDLQVGSSTHPLYVHTLEDLQKYLQEKYSGSFITQTTLSAIQSEANAILRGTAYFDTRSPFATTIHAAGGTTLSQFDYVPTATTASGTVDFFISNAGAATFARFVPEYSEKQQKIWDLKHKMKTNLLIKVNSRAKPLTISVSPAEEIARFSLRDQITEAEWRRYVTNGFIMVKGVSGRFYQIFNNDSNRVRVFYKNKQTHQICIHTDKNCPPTDHVLNLKTLIEMDESLIWKAGNVSNFTAPSIRANGVNIFADGLQTFGFNDNFALAC